MPLPKFEECLFEKILNVQKEEQRFIANRYLFEKPLGTGSFASVHLVRDVKQPQAIFRAAKEILLSSGEEENSWTDAVKEAQTLSDLHHPHVVELCDAFLEKSSFYIIMDYCQNGTLESTIHEARKGNKYFPEGQIICWLVQLADALSYIHSRKIIHRDLKSRNIFLNRQQNLDQKWHDLKIGDFGISRVLYTSTEKATTMIGTPFYLSPELLQQLPYDRKADSWALGCLLFEMCSLTYPFNTTGRFGDLMKFIVYGEPNYSNFPVALCIFQPLCKKLLKKIPDDRPSAEDVLGHPLVSMHLNNHLSQHEYCRNMNIQSVTRDEHENHFSTEHVDEQTFGTNAPNTAHLDYQINNDLSLNWNDSSDLSNTLIS